MLENLLCLVRGSCQPTKQKRTNRLKLARDSSSFMGRSNSRCRHDCHRLIQVHVEEDHGISLYSGQGGC